MQHESRGEHRGGADHETARPVFVMRQSVCLGKSYGQEYISLAAESRITYNKFHGNQSI